MSGPKYSRARIKELQRLKQFQRELEEQIEKSKCNQIISDMEKLQSQRMQLFNDDIIKICERISEEAKTMIPDSKSLSYLNNILLKIKKQQSKQWEFTGNSDELMKSLLKMQEDTKELECHMRMLHELRKQLSVEGTNALQESNYESFMSTDWIELTESTEKPEVIPEDLKEIYFEVLELLSKRPDYDALKKSLDDTIMKVGDNTYKRRQLEMRRDALRIENNKSQDPLKTMSLKNELRCLYNLLHWEEKEIPNDPNEIVTQIEKAKVVLKQKQASGYIAESVHAVLEKRGYRLLDDAVVSTNNVASKKEFYKFGEKSLINVSMSDKGQLLFEVVGDSSKMEINESGAVQLESEMRRFCPDYAEVRECLQKEYGIYLEDEHLYDADRKYARVVDVSTEQTDRRNKRGKKMMHYDD